MTSSSKQAAENLPQQSAGVPHYPLSGVTVIDLSHIYNGPYATYLMALAGAEVIKVEPHGGEHLRHRADLGGGAALPFAMLNGNKRAVTMNLKNKRGKELLLDMVKKADVFVENFAPGATERLGLGLEDLRRVNPQIIYASSTGYGRSGPYRDFPAMDLTVQAMSGAMSVTGYPDGPPTKCGPALADFFAGIHLYGGIVTALYDREKSGVGRMVEVSMQEAMYVSLASNLGMYLGLGNKSPPRTGNRHGGMAEAPYNVYKTSDGWIAIICPSERHWVGLTEAMQAPQLKTDPRFTNLKVRVKNIDDVDAVVGGWTVQHPRQHIVELLQQHRVPHAPVRDMQEVIRDPHMHARGTLQDIKHPEYGDITVQHSPMHYEGVERMPLRPSSKAGADGREVFVDWLGIPREEFDALVKQGVL
ncbi:MAG: CoA transferase [Betaproteobacteria bacterium]|nr:CoA transferase [Betaproteobacteria bacterium]